MELMADRLEFHLDKIPQRFVIINNLQEFGLAIENVFSKWINLSADISAESLCRFIRSENEDIICLTEAEYYDWANAR